MSAGTRLVLWDLDGTLLRVGGVSREAFAAAVATVLEGHVLAEDLSFAGRTDRWIAAAVLEQAGADQGLAAPLLSAYARELALRHLEVRRRGRVLPHAHETLGALAAGHVHQGVVTGNLAATARVKVAALGLEAHLDLDASAFGDDGDTRDHLVPVAIGRAGSPDPARVWVVGDTEHDLACARRRVRCLLVATGGSSVEQLEALGADAVLPDLAGAADVLLGSSRPA